MKKAILLLLVFSILSCTKNEELTATQILEKTYEVSGKEKLKTATLSFDYRDIRYKAKRNANEYRFSMTREKDTIIYNAVAYNGGFEYTENEIPKSYGGQNAQVEKQLMALNNFIAYPLPFMEDTSVQKSLLEDIEIKGKNYYAVKITHTAMLPTDLIENVVLYIDKEKFKIDYIAYDFQPAKGRLFFRETFNERMINGVRIVDYNTFRTKEPTSALDSLPIWFENNELSTQSVFDLQNVTID